MIPRKYKVFISSTFKGIEAARGAAIAGVYDTGHIPIALDVFASQSPRDLEIMEREIYDCHVYILILGPVYGGKPSGEERSHTEIEFDLAESTNRFMLIFPLNWDDVLEQRRQLGVKDDDLESLERFYSRAKNRGHFFREWRWDSAEAIRRHVVIALAELPMTNTAPRGLIPEPFQSELFDFFMQNKFLQEMFAATQSFDRLYLNIKKNVEAKTRAAEFLTEMYQLRMEADETKGIFFESGSTVTFVAKTFPASFWQRVGFTKRGELSKRITTNSFMVYLLLWLSKGIPCAHFPWGLPDKLYGASYGPIGALGVREPNFNGKPLDPEAREAIESLNASPLALKPENTSLIITAASGMQLGKEHKIVGEEGFEIPDHVKSNINLCFGPHVGNYQNKTLKRYLYQTRIPTVLVTDSSKIDCPIDVRKSHFIFGVDLTWESILKDHPLALCVGCLSEELNRLMDLVQEAMPGFNLVGTEQLRKYSAFIARNTAFEQAFPQQVSLP